MAYSLYDLNAAQMNRQLGQGYAVQDQPYYLSQDPQTQAMVAPQPAGGIANTVADIGGKYAGQQLISGGASSVGSNSIGAGLTEAGLGSSGSGYTLSGAAPAPGTFSLNGIGSAGNAILPAAGAYGAYDLISRQGDAPRGNYARGIGQGAASGAAIGSYGGPMGAVIGGAVGGLVGGIGAFSGSGKSRQQMQRDELRKGLISGGLLDSNYQLSLADGKTFDMGKDGGFRLKNVDGTDRKIEEIDKSAKTAGEAQQYSTLLSRMIGAGNEDLKGMLTNAIQSSGDDSNLVKANAKAILAKTGATDAGTALGGLYDMARGGAMSRDEYMQAKQGLLALYGDKDAKGNPVRATRKYGNYTIPVYEIF